MSLEQTEFRGWRYLPAWLAISFVLHVAWEHAQMPLYVMPQMTGAQALRACIFAAATGDMVFMLVLHLTLTMVHETPAWPVTRPCVHQMRTWWLLALLGSLLAASYELWAVYAVHRWTYAAAMPLIPVVRVGLSPLLQMLVVPALTVVLLGRLPLDPKRVARRPRTAHDSVSSRGDTERAPPGPPD